MIFRRPELEKDNPMAPQPYVGPRRRLALARAAGLKEFTGENDLKKALQDLTLAASNYVDRVSKTRKTEKKPEDTAGCDCTSQASDGNRRR